MAKANGKGKVVPPPPPPSSFASQDSRPRDVPIHSDSVDLSFEGVSPNHEAGECSVAIFMAGRFENVLEIGGGAGKVSHFINKGLRDPQRHVVVEPGCWGHLAKHLHRNKELHDDKYTIVQKRAEDLDVDDLAPLRGPVDCVFADCEGCLKDFFERPLGKEILTVVRYVVNEMDGNNVYLEHLWHNHGLVLIHRGYGCGMRGNTDVYARASVQGQSSLGNPIHESLPDEDHELLPYTCVTRGPIESARAIRFQQGSGITGDMYYHFIFDGILPFFLLMQRHTSKQRWIVRIEHGAVFAKQFAAMFSDVDIEYVEKARLSEGGDVATVHLRKLGFPFPATFGRSARKLQAYVWEHFSIKQNPPHVLLFVVRKPWQPHASKARHGAARRSLANEEEISAFLEEAASNLGLEYQQCSPEELTIAEEVQVFANTHVLVAQNGSGMAGMLWMMSQAHVVEIGPPSPGKGKLNTFESLCQALNLSWTACAAPAPWCGSLTVPMSELHAVFEPLQRQFR